MRYFDVPLPANCRERRHAPLVRTVAARDMDFTLDVIDEVGISVKTSAAYAMTCRGEGKLLHQIGDVGHVAVNAPGQRFHVAIHGEFRATQIAIPMTLVREIAEEDHGVDPNRVEIHHVHSAEDHRLLALVCRAAILTDRAKQGLLMREIVADLLERHSDLRSRTVRRTLGGIAPGRLRGVRDRVETDLLSISVAEMAAEARLSPFHFAREFRRSVGESPWNYVISRRVVRAIGILGDRRLTLDQVAARSGFANSSHLCRHLQRRLDTTATGIRAALLM